METLEQWRCWLPRMGQKGIYSDFDIKVTATKNVLLVLRKKTLKEISLANKTITLLSFESPMCKVFNCMKSGI